MSWDVFVMAARADWRDLGDIPPDWKMLPIGPRPDVMERVRDFAPDLDTRDPTWWTLERQEFVIEFNGGDSEVMDSFTLRVHGGDEAVEFIDALLTHLNVRAADYSSGRFWVHEQALKSFQACRGFRNAAVTGQYRVVAVLPAAPTKDQEP